MNSAVTWLLILVLSKSKNGGKDADTWAWIDITAINAGLDTRAGCDEYHRKCFTNHASSS